MTDEQVPGAQYSPNPSLYNAFWNTVNKLTQPMPQTGQQKKEYEAKKSAAAFHKVSENISEIKEFVSDLEEVAEKIQDAGGKTTNLLHLIRSIKRRLVILDVAVGATNDAIQAAVEVQIDLSAWYRDAYNKCKSDGTDDPFRDQEFVCIAAIDRHYQGHNVKFVLGNQDGSFVRRIFNKWRDRLKNLVLP